MVTDLIGGWTSPVKNGLVNQPPQPFVDIGEHEKCLKTTKQSSIITWVANGIYPLVHQQSKPIIVFLDRGWVDWS